MKKTIGTLLKIGLSVGIIGYLVWKASQGEVNVFEQLRDPSLPKVWGLLAAGCGLLVTANVLTFIRWCCLCRALGIPLRLVDAIRIGFWGFLFNLMPLGVVGGDVVKAAMLAHEHREYRVKAVAAVLVDRVIGLYVLFAYAAVAILLTGFWTIPDEKIRWICNATFLIAGVGGLGIAVVLTSDMAKHLCLRMARLVPRVGHVVENLLDAIWMYRSRPLALLAASLVTVVVHSFSSLGVYLIARGLPGGVLPLTEHFVLVPLCVATGVLPLPMGPFEYALDFLYAAVPVPAGVTITPHKGVVVGLVYRLASLVTAAVGTPFYLSRRRELAEVMHEAEAEVDV